MKPFVFVCQYSPSQNIYIVSQIDGSDVHVCDNLSEIEEFINNLKNEQNI